MTGKEKVEAQREKVEAQYEEKFGGLPYFLIMDASDEYVIEKLSECIKTGKELQPETKARY